MNATRNHSRSSLFLIELILAILFFSIASAVCVQLFARAHTISADSTNRNRALLCAQSAADILRTGGDPTLILNAQKENDSFTVYYNRDWESLPASESTEAKHKMIFSPILSDNGLTDWEIIVYHLSTSEKQIELYRLQIRQYTPHSSKTEGIP